MTYGYQNREPQKNTTNERSSLPHVTALLSALPRLPENSPGTRRCAELMRDRQGAHRAITCVGD